MCCSNAEPEFMDPNLIKFALQMTHDLDVKFQRTPKTVMSQRDVPGMTRSIIPILKSMNITGISVGVNGGSTPPNVPKAFIWKDPNSGEVRSLVNHIEYGTFLLLEHSSFVFRRRLWWSGSFKR